MRKDPGVEPTRGEVMAEANNDMMEDTGWRIIFHSCIEMPKLLTDRPKWIDMSKTPWGEEEW